MQANRTPSPDIARITGGRRGVLAAPALFLGLLALAGCANPQADQALYAQQAFVGMPKQTLLSCAGVPERQAAVDNVEYFTYTAERVTTRPALSPGFGARGFYHPWYGGYGYGAGFGWDDYYGDVETRSCRATFTLKDGRVSQIVYGSASDGATARLGQCYTIVENCLALIPQPASTPR